MAGSTLEQLKACVAERRQPALAREDRALTERYAGQYVAYLDDWDDRYDVVRTVLVATPDLAEFERLRGAIDPGVRFRVTSVAIPPAAPLRDPPPKDHTVIRELLSLLNAKTPTQKEALRRVDDALSERYPGQWVAFVDHWRGEELVRAVLVAAAEVGPFYERVDELPADVRARLRCMLVPDPNVFEVRPVWFE